MDVDLVYTWVNPLDLDVKRQRGEYSGHVALPDSEYAAGAARYRDNGELRHSLRSAERFLPFVRNIYVVCSGQPPHWFSGMGKVRFIHQNDLLPKRLQPTFQSDVVESFVQAIPGLSEHYIYANDDFFFAAPHQPSDFFDGEGRCLVGVCDRFVAMGNKSHVYRAMELNSLHAVARHARMLPYVETEPTGRPRALSYMKTRAKAAMSGVGLHNTPTHVAQPYLKSEWRRFSQEFARELDILYLGRFRSETSFAVNLAYHHFLRSRGKAVFRYARDHRFLDRTDPPESRAALSDALTTGEPSISRFCLNDNTAAPDDGWPEFLAATLGSLFPTAGLYEKAIPADGGPPPVHDLQAKEAS